MSIYNKIIPDGLFDKSDTFDRYHLGMFYKQYVLQKEYHPYQFNGWDDKKFYGIIDNNNNIVYPKEEALKVYTSNDAAHKNILFVTDAFLDLKKYYADLIKDSKVSNSSIYTRLNVSESTTDSLQYYIKYISDVHRIFSDLYIDENIKKQITSFSTFIPHLFRFFKIILKSFTINRSTFIKSGFTPSSINGLRINLIDVKNTLDLRMNSNMFMNSPEFYTFLDIAGRFGFFVDRNQPWTIVADIDSQAMKKYYRPYGLYTVDDVFNRLYYRAYTADLVSLKNVVIGFWNSYISSRNLITDYKDMINCKNIFISQTSLTPVDVTLFDRYYNIDWQLRMYLYTRVLEENLNITQNKFEIFFQEACKINLLEDTAKALLYINEKVNETIQLSRSEINPLTNPDAIYTLLTSGKISLPGEGINF